MSTTGGPFAAGEITEAYADLHRAVQGYADSGEWAGFADHFTEDAEYVEHAFGTFRGREEDVYNPLRFLAMSLRWARVAQRHGNLDAAGRVYLEEHG